MDKIVVVIPKVLGPTSIESVQGDVFKVAKPEIVEQRFEIEGELAKVEKGDELIVEYDERGIIRCAKRTYQRPAERDPPTAG